MFKQSTMLKEMFAAITGKRLTSPDPTASHIRDYQRTEVRLSNGAYVLEETWFDVRKNTRMFQSTPITR